MVLLILIYFVFIGVGLPDSLLGSAWPFMVGEYQVGVDSAGILSIIISIGIIMASLTACYVIKKVGFLIATICGLGFMLIGLVGFVMSPSFGWILFCCAPLGFGSGLLQTLLNNFVAQHYSARHMNWLHGSWGIGAVVGPLLVSSLGEKAVGWRGGYIVVALAEAILIGAVLLAFPLWKKTQKLVGSTNISTKLERERHKRVSVKGKGFVVGQFFLYCSMENAMMLWGASYLIGAKGMEAFQAAKGVSLFFLGITIGRFLGGMLAGKIGNVTMIFGSVAVVTILDMVLLLSKRTETALFVFLLLGLIMAPIYPAMLHETPSFFPRENLQLLMGVQVASAYAGITIMPPLFGKLFTVVSFQILPVLQMCFLGCVLFCVIVLHQRAAKGQEIFA